MREAKFAPKTATLDKGYDVKPVYDACERAGALPIIRSGRRPPSSSENCAPECGRLARSA